MTVTTRSVPPWLLLARLLGTVALIGSLAAIARPAAVPSWAGLALILGFFVLRVGSEWLLAFLRPDEEGRHRRSAILNTLIAVAVTAFWFYLRKRGLSF
jgi:ascorbate-specific PTS system EIIC-type component UlaA